MATTKMVREIDPDRRRLFAAAAMVAATSQLGMLKSVAAQPVEAKSPAIKPGTNTSFGPLKQIEAGVLNVGYAEAGPMNGPVVILLHGWPYDIYSFVDVAPLLAGAGYRVLIPYLRGYGTTRFLKPEIVRNGQPSALAVDLRTFSMPSRSRNRSSPASIGEGGPPTSSRRSGRSAAGPWCR